MRNGEEELAELVGLLDKVEQRADGFMACCPCHDDTTPSLSLKVGYTGKLVVRCFSGCDATDVLNELTRIRRSGKAVVKTTKVRAGEKVKTKNATTKTTGRAWTLEQLVKRAGADHVFAYHNAKREKVAVALRWDATDDQKRKFRQASFNRDIGLWEELGPKELVLPFQHDSVTATKPKGSRPVLVVEGEKCAILAREKLYATAVTSMGGSGAAKKTDWGLLGGHDVVIWPDNDEPGMKYLDDVVELLLRLKEPPRSIKVIEPPSCLGDAEDVVDWHNLKCAEGMSDADIRSAFNELLATATPYPLQQERSIWDDSDDAIDESDDVGAAFLEGRIDEATYEHTTKPPAVSIVISDDIQPANAVVSGHQDDSNPFPVDALGPTLADIVDKMSIRLRVDPAYFGLPMLPILAFTIGDSHLLQLDNDWRVRPMLYAALIAATGTRKTAPLEFLEQPIADHQAYLNEQHEKRVRDTEKGSPPPAPVDMLVEDFTPEALIPIFRDNPRGLIAIGQELTGILVPKNYGNKGSGGVQDNSLLCKAWDGSGWTKHRAVDRLRISAPQCRLCIAGNLTLEDAPDIFNARTQASGLAPRFLVAMPPEDTRKRVKYPPDSSPADAWRELCLANMSLHPEELHNGKRLVRQPKVVRLCDAADLLWWEWYEAHQDEMREFDGGLRGAYSKLEQVCGRIALVLHVSELSLGSGIDPLSIRLDVIERAIRITEYLKREACKVYGKWASGDGSGNTKTPLLESNKPLLWILDKLQECSRLRVSDVQKGVNAHRHKIEATMMQRYIELFVSRGILQWLDADKIWFGLANEKSPTK